GEPGGRARGGEGGGGGRGVGEEEEPVVGPAGPAGQQGGGRQAGQRGHQERSQERRREVPRRDRDPWIVVGRGPAPAGEQRQQPERAQCRGQGGQGQQPGHRPARAPRRVEEVRRRE